MNQYPDPQDDWSAWDAPTAPMSPGAAPSYQPYAPPIPSQSPQTPAPPYQTIRTAPAQRGRVATPPDGPPQRRLPGARITQPRPDMATTAPLGVINAPPNAPDSPPYAPGPARPSRARPPRRRWRRVVGVGLLLVLLLTLVGGGLLAKRYYDFGVGISPQAPFSSQTGYVSGSGRVNIVVFGFDGPGYGGAYLSDSILVMSLIPSDHATTLLSVPRDLWVQVPPNSGNYAKLNTAFADGYFNGYGKFGPGFQAAGAEGAEKVSEVTGLNVTYWVSLDFETFRTVVDSLGGIEINVPVGFTVTNPETGGVVTKFVAGPQHMNGARALEYARARYIYDVPSEGTDFARSRRQQLIVEAIMQRLKQPGAWPGLLNATNALQSGIRSNLSVTDLSLFASKMDLKNAAHVGLTNDNVLVDATSSDGQAILLPANGDWNAVKQYVASQLKN